MGHALLSPTNNTYNSRATTIKDAEGEDDDKADLEHDRTRANTPQETPLTVPQPWMPPQCAQRLQCRASGSLQNLRDAG